jgi:diguanylate cyclase (GGDEF)-like protein
MVAAMLTALAAVSSSMSMAYPGLLTIAFIMVGLSQPRWTTLWLLPLAIPVWYFAQGGPTAVLNIRLPITVAVWVVIGETLSAQTTRLASEAHTDPLTGLGNRRALDTVLGALQPGDSVVLIDLDHFKDFNDSFGHQEGDAVLAAFGDQLRRCLGPDERALRYGGEEFLVLLPGGGANEPGAFLARCRDTWKLSHGLTFSSGVAVHQCGERPMATLRRADQALYRAKASGRDRWRYDGQALG